MNKHNTTQIAHRQYSPGGYLLGASIAKLALLIWHAFTILISGFIAIVFKSHRRTERPVQEQRAELMRENLALEQVTQLEDQFISIASHELKTPMTTISGHAQLLLRRVSRVPELSNEMVVIRSALESIDGQTRRLNALVNQLLDLSSIRAGKIDLDRQACNLVDICRAVVEDQRLLTGRNVELIAPSASVMLWGDCERLSNTVINLVDNALKFSPENSPVKIHVSQGTRVALIRVSDAGPGIPREQQAHIFESFYRGPEVKATSRSGLGLGLTICKEIAERHGGHIWCESQEGIGSAFFVELPLHQG